jgi:hypothetical protein
MTRTPVSGFACRGMRAEAATFRQANNGDIRILVVAARSDSLPINPATSGLKE